MGSRLSICLSIYWPHWPLHPRCCQAEVGLRDPGDLDLGRPQLPLCGQDRGSHTLQGKG